MEQPSFTPPFTPVADSEHRSALRRAVKMRAHLRDRGQTRFEIDVVDLSESGFRAETSFTLWPGTVVWLTLPGLAPLEAVVAWRDRFQLPGGREGSNCGMHEFELRWGRVSAMTVHCDTARLAGYLAEVAAAGQPEAAAPPIT